MYSYILQIDGTAQGDALFATKRAAMAAFNRAFTFSGSVTLHQGAFTRAQSGFVRQHGRAFLLAKDEFNDDGEVLS